MTIRNILLAAIAISAIGVPAVAQMVTGDNTKVEVTPGKAHYTSTVKAEATVNKLNQKTRAVTLTGPKGKEYSFTAGPEVKNLDKIKVGAKVVADYVESLTLTLMKGGKEALGRTESNVETAAKPGEKPGAGVTSRTPIIANVVKIDKKAGVVTLQGLTEKLHLNVKDPAQLKLIKVGDQVKAVITPAVAISVVPAAK